jgi:hypothetical protein
MIDTFENVPEVPSDIAESKIFIVCILLCVISKIYDGTVYTTTILKETKWTLLCQHLFLLAVDGNALPQTANKNTCYP